MPGKRGVPREVDGKTKGQICEESKALSRWPPLMMRAIATSLQLGPIKASIKFRALSWKEHVGAGHTTFRKDCMVCQQASAKDQHHRRCKDPPRAGVLSLDMSGPFHVAPDLHSKKAKYLLVGAFTWLAPGQSPDDIEEAAPPNLPEAAPEIENPDGEDPEIEDADDVWGDVRAEKKRRAQEKADEERKDEQCEEGKEDDQQGHLEAKVPKVEATRICVLLPPKSQYELLRAIIDVYMRLRSDGFVATQIHTDRDGEFKANLCQKHWTNGAHLALSSTHTPLQINHSAMAMWKPRSSGSRRGSEGFFTPLIRPSLCGLLLLGTSMSALVLARTLHLPTLCLQF